MRAPKRLAVALLPFAAVIAAGCGQTNELNVVEGQPVQLGSLSYNVQITRFLNPADPEDMGYLAGQPAPKRGQFYLAVFMLIHNTGDSVATLPTGFEVKDTEGKTYKPLPSKSLFALKLGGKVGPGLQVPDPESTAANGPIQGAMVLFRISAKSIENRPLTLHIPGPTETGRVQLDI